MFQLIRTYKRTDFLFVAVGAIPGAVIRWQIGNDLLPNIIGAAVLGFLVALPLKRNRQLLIGAGFCGSLTTFSGWLLTCTELIEIGNYFSAIRLLTLTIVLGALAIFLGFSIGKAIKL